MSEEIYEVKFDSGLDLSQANLLDGFSFPWKEEDSPETTFRAVWNERVFSFRFDVEDADIVLAENEDTGSAALGSDRVELFFATTPDLKESYYGAEMDPVGRCFDYQASYYREIDSSWSFDSLTFGGRIRESGYSVSGQIHMEELKDLKLITDQVILGGIFRAEFSREEKGVVQEDWISWIDPKTEKPDFHVPSAFGKLQLLAPR